VHCEKLVRLRLAAGRASGQHANYLIIAVGDQQVSRLVDRNSGRTAETRGPANAVDVAAPFP
jgi:hypothetical protein